MRRFAIEAIVGKFLAELEEFKDEPRERDDLSKRIAQAIVLAHLEEGDANALADFWERQEEGEA